jgi:transporter family-2 protein
MWRRCECDVEASMKSGLVVGAAVLCGVAVAIQAQFTGIMHRQIGTLESTFVTYFSGGLVIGLAMLLARGGNLAASSGLPWYVYTAGLLGLVVIATLSLSVGEIGLVPALVLMTVSQFVVGALINHFGLLGAAVAPIDLGKIAGFVLLGLGTFLVLR